MEAEDELLMGAKIGFQRLCHLRHRAGQCLHIHSGGKVSQSSSIDLSLLSEERGKECLCVHVHRLNRMLTTLLHAETFTSQ